MNGIFQFITNPLRSLPSGGCGDERNQLKVHVRDSRRVQAPDYSAPASRLGFSDELTFLSFSGRPGIRCRMPRRYIGCCPSDYEQVDEFTDRSRLQAALVAAQPEDRLAPFLRKAAVQVPAEFRFEQGNAFVTAAVVAERIFYRHLERGGSVPEENLQLVSD